MEKFFPLCLSETIKQGYEGQNIVHILHCIECDTENISISSEDLDIIAPFLHEIYAKMGYNARSAVLRIILNIELNSEETILEKYNFEYLISRSLEAPLPDPVPKVDEEKVAAFRNVSVQIKYRQTLQTPIINSLIWLYRQPKQSYKSLVLGYLCEAVLVCQNLGEAYNIGKIIIDSYIESPTIELCGFVSYCIEKKHPTLRYTKSITRLISSLTQIHGVQQNVLENSTKSLAFLLRTWPGLLGYAVSNNVFGDLSRCITHVPGAIARLFTDIVKYNCPKGCVLDSHTGLLLFCIHKYGFMKELEAKAHSFIALEKLYRKLNELSSVEIVALAPPEVDSTTVPVKSALIYSIIDPLTIKTIPSSISEVTPLPEDYFQWNWSTIKTLLTVTLPNNEAESQSPAAKKFYDQVIKYFGHEFSCTEPPDTQIIAGSLEALFEHLLPKQWGYSIIESSTELRNAMTLAVHTLRKKENPRKECYEWAFFTVVARLMSRADGIALLNRWGMQPALIELADKMTNLPTAQHAMSMLELFPEFGFVAPIYTAYLNSSNPAISESALESLQAKRHRTPNFHVAGFRQILVPYVKATAAKGQSDRLTHALRAVYEDIKADPRCLEFAANDVQLHQVLCTHGPIGYSLLLASPAAVPVCDVDGLIQWWFDTGNRTYTKVFDAAVTASFEDTIAATAKNQPAIISTNGVAFVPPHLFGELAKHEAGLSKLTPHIPKLVEELHSKSTHNQRDAMYALAHFASSPLADSIVEKYDLAAQMLDAAMQSSSFVLRGALLTAFSLVHQSHYFVTFLRAHNWEVFRFGRSFAVVPSDPIAFVQRSGHSKKVTAPHLPVPKGAKEICRYLVALISPLTSSSAKSYCEAHKEELLVPEVALYAARILGGYCFADEVRRYLWHRTENVSLMGRGAFVEGDERDKAEARARLFVITKRGANEPEGARTFDVPTYPRAQLAAQCVPEDCAEWFVSDDYLVSVAGVTRDEFYQQSEERMAEVRRRLITS